MFGSGSNNATSSQALALHLLRQVLEVVTGLDVRLVEWKLRTVATNKDPQRGIEFKTIKIKSVHYYVFANKCCGSHYAEFLLCLRKDSCTGQWEPDNSTLFGRSSVSSSGYGKFIVYWTDFSQLAITSPVTIAACE